MAVRRLKGRGEYYRASRDGKRQNDPSGIHPGHVTQRELMVLRQL